MGEERDGGGGRKGGISEVSWNKVDIIEKSNCLKNLIRTTINTKFLKRMTLTSN